MQIREEVAANKDANAYCISNTVQQATTETFTKSGGREKIQSRTVHVIGTW